MVSLLSHVVGDVSPMLSSSTSAEYYRHWRGGGGCLNFDDHITERGCLAWPIPESNLRLDEGIVIC